MIFFFLLPVSSNFSLALSLLYSFSLAMSKSALTHHDLFKVRVLIIPGNGYPPVFKRNWYMAVCEDLRARGCIAEGLDMPCSLEAYQSIWLPFITNKISENPSLPTILVGHSSGAVALLRLMEQRKVDAAVLVSVYCTDLGICKHCTVTPLRLVSYLILPSDEKKEIRKGQKRAKPKNVCGKPSLTSTLLVVVYLPLLPSCLSFAVANCLFLFVGSLIHLRSSFSPYQNLSFSLLLLLPLSILRLFAWGFTNDSGDPSEAISGYFDHPWDWKAIRSHCGSRKLVQFASPDDPLAPVAEQRFVAQHIDSELIELAHRGHFMEPQFPELTTKVIEIATALCASSPSPASSAPVMSSSVWLPVSSSSSSASASSSSSRAADGLSSARSKRF